MSNNKFFGKYILLTQMDARIVAKTPLRIGVGREMDVIESDLPIIRNSQNTPILPGSSLKGFFRANTERLLLNLKPKSEVEALITRLFGSSEKNSAASAVLFHDMPASTYKVENRKHVKINPETSGASNLFEVECVMDGATFEGRLATTRNLSPAFLGFIQPVIDLSSLGISRIGGFKSRGYGSIEITVTRLNLIVPGKSKENLEKGIELHPTIGTGNPTLIQVKNSEVKLKELGEITFKAKAEAALGYLGTKLVVEDEAEITKLLSSLADQFQKYLTG